MAIFELCLSDRSDGICPAEERLTEALDAWSGCRKSLPRAPFGLPCRPVSIVKPDQVSSSYAPLPDAPFSGVSVCHGLGEVGDECEADMFGMASKWCSAGDEMADSVSIKEDMTSVDAGFTTTRLDERRPPSWC